MTNNVEQLILAPMEGVLDELLRDLLTSINDFDLCITEFIRVVDSLIPSHVFYKTIPELHYAGYTRSKTPIRVQLLGQHPQWMAENAVRAIDLGSHGVDINFGCPSKTVNNNQGGAALLKSPETIFQITSAVKKAIGPENDLSVKIRLGFNDTNLLEEIVDAITQGKADLLTIHARTKLQGYKAPAYWNFIAPISHNYNIPLVANGEIWNKTDAINCIYQSKTNNLMLGRGALALPNLANVIKHQHAEMSWKETCQLLKTYSEHELQGQKSYYFSSRLKQWLRYLKLHYPEAEALFNMIKTLKDKDKILALIDPL